MMEQIVPLFLALAAGAGLGLFHFGGLWWTLERLPQAKRPGLWMLASFLARTALTLVGAYVVMQGHWERLLFCVTGILLVRLAVVRRLGPGRVREHGEGRAL